MIEKPSTKELLARSLMEIAASKPVDKISVREIATNCGVTAATFYNHFDNKYDLMAWINNRDTDSATDLFGKKNTWSDTLLLYVEALLRWRAFFENALKNTQGSESFHTKTFGHFLAHALEHIHLLHGVERFDDEVEFALRFYFRALSHELVDWLVRKDDVPAERLVAWLADDMPPCLYPVLLDI